MSGERILVVDDNEANAALVSFLLKKRGYEVRIAVDAPEALAEVRTFAPRLILMDVQLPGIDGLELTRRIKADPTSRHIMIVAVTSYAMKGDEARALQAGCDGYLSKPIDTRALPGLVEKYLLRSSGPDGTGGRGHEP